MEPKTHPVIATRTAVNVSSNKLAPYGTDGGLFASDVSAKFKVT